MRNFTNVLSAGVFTLAVAIGATPLVGCSSDDGDTTDVTDDTETDDATDDTEETDEETDETDAA